jgi:hypothetical protein
METPPYDIWLNREIKNLFPKRRGALFSYLSGFPAGISTLAEMHRRLPRDHRAFPFPSLDKRIVF